MESEAEAEGLDSFFSSNNEATFFSKSLTRFMRVAVSTVEPLIVRIDREAEEKGVPTKFEFNWI